MYLILQSSVVVHNTHTHTRQAHNALIQKLDLLNVRTTTRVYGSRGRAYHVVKATGSAKCEFPN